MKNTIKKERENLGMTQAELAKKSGVARTIVSGLESGRIKVTTTDTIEKRACNQHSFWYHLWSSKWTNHLVTHPVRKAPRGSLP